MTKAKTHTGKASAKMAPGKRQGVSAKNAGAKRATAKSSTAKQSSTAKRSKRGAGARTSAREQRAGAEGAPASRAEDATSASRQSASGGARPSKTNQDGRPGAGPALHQIRKRQSPSQIIASASRAAGIHPRAGKVFTESFMTTIKRHLVRGAVGRVDVPGLNAVLYRGMLPARKERTMMSPLLNREVTMPARDARPVPKFRAHPALREIVARV